MEVEAQKMLALKRAYAEIILNTAKEAAARVMASERKARSFQQDLRATKDEALRMLLRLKQMIDSKTTEAEMTSLRQRRRIEELEAQLNEAEDVIADLRTELTQLWDALEKAKSNQLQHLDGQIMKGHESSHENTAPEPIIPSPSISGLEAVTTSKMKTAPLDQRVSVNKCCNTTKETGQLGISLLDKYHAHNSDFASIIMRRKQPELYRNGFTQRIRAFERNFPHGKVPPSGDVDDRHSLEKNELITKVIDKEEGRCHVSSTRTSNMEIVRNSTGEEVKKPVKKVRMSRKRKTRFGKAKATSRKSCPRRGQHMKLCQPSAVLSCHKTYLINGNVKSAEGACTQPPIEADKEEVETVHNEKGKKIESRDTIASFRSLPDQLRKPCQPSTVLSRCRTSSCSGNGNIKSDEDRSKVNEIKSEIKPLTRLVPGFTLIKHDADPISGSTDLTVSIKVINKSGLIQNVEDMELVDKSMLVKHEGDAAENLINLGSELDVGKIDVPLMNSSLKDAEVSETSNGSPSPADNNRLLRYTFQRKRKKESFSKPDENSSIQNSTIKRRAVEKQSGASEPQDCSLINESSRDSRRLAQVARQLISLSGKRWW
ncbi:uncharacterized protein LOC132181401 [Corylus avellana]|uniref:uncharacterized protein LOC132181401 n=1 Tax=Corylus avellana TaxID=13451 RepID=UPI00286D219F|nr:uncharacterized protein LOC132181401 [Corylus avellana]